MRTLANQIAEWSTNGLQEARPRGRRASDAIDHAVGGLGYGDTTTVTLRDPYGRTFDVHLRMRRDDTVAWTVCRNSTPNPQDPTVCNAHGAFLQAPDEPESTPATAPWLRPGCHEPATCWQGGGPYCEPDAASNATEEGGGYIHAPNDVTGFRGYYEHRRV